MADFVDVFNSLTTSDYFPNKYLLNTYYMQNILF